MEGWGELGKLAKSDTCSCFLLVHLPRPLYSPADHGNFPEDRLGHSPSPSARFTSLRVGFRPLCETNQFRGHARVRARRP